jgi:hypothetical protein
MINPELDDFIQQELAQSSGWAQQSMPGDAPVPRRLFHAADAAGVETVVRRRALRALDWRLGWDGPLVRYGVELVETFLHQRADATADPLREQFRRATLLNFNPCGSHFDGFVARLFECAEPQSLPGYAIGFAAAHAGASMQLLPAIYSHEQQLAIVQMLYQCCEDYFVSAVHRFGEQHRTELLTPCWDKFRQCIGACLMRFRAPAACHEREWIALALGAAAQADDAIGFVVVDNRLVPVVAIDIGALPLDVIAIGAALPFESTREALSAFLRRQRTHGVAIVRASSLAT